MRKLKDYFADWTKFELGLLITGLSISILSSIIFHGNAIDTLYTSSYLITALLMAKGKVECYLVGFVSVFFYGIVLGLILILCYFTPLFFLERKPRASYSFKCFVVPL